MKLEKLKLGMVVRARSPGDDALAPRPPRGAPSEIGERFAGRGPALATKIRALRGASALRRLDARSRR